MSTLLNRYLAGEYKQAWEGAMALGDAVRQEVYYPDATAVRVGTAGSLDYLATDGLGSISVAVDDSGNVVASQLYAPYGSGRYSSGTMPTSKGFTGQRADVVSGLDYYGARYYDPVAGQFTSADSVSQGLSRYA